MKVFVKALVLALQVAAFVGCTTAADAEDAGLGTIYVNRELEKDVSHVFGSRRPRGARIDVEQLESPHDADADALSAGARASLFRGHGHRRTTGEVPIPPEFVEDEEAEEAATVEEETPFFKGETLDYYKKGMDPDFFEWVNPDEIAPGETTCGFLKPELGTAPNLVFPQIEVYVCMRFADEQPAKKGNIFVHCGGPSSLSDCSMVYDLGNQSLVDYNFLTIDQRGLGRSWPSFGHEACNLYAPFVRDENETIIDGTMPPEHVNGTDYTDVDSIKLRLEPYKRRVFRCWGCTDCDFKLTATQEDGSENTYHFLEYSGTRQLSEDIERMRILLNSPLMHVYGISYGTSVMATYATLYPQNVGLFVIDSNVNPIQDLEYNAWTMGRGEDTRINYGLYSCSASNIEEPGSCPIEDLPKCIGDLNALLRQIDIGFAEGRTYLGKLLVEMYNTVGAAEEICALAAAGDVDGIEDILEDIYAEQSVATARQAIGDPASRPTSAEDVYGNPDYYWRMLGGVPQYSIEAQDGFSALYDADYFAKKIVEFANLFTGAGTGTPAALVFQEWAKGFYWPKGVPLAPMGNPYLTGIVSGQLYDYATPYPWTMNMRNGFKMTSLLTSQATQHGLTAIEPTCQQHIIDYFTNGYVDFVDGTVCGADYADVSTFTSAFGLGK